MRWLLSEELLESSWTCSSQQISSENSSWNEQTQLRNQKAASGKPSNASGHSCKTAASLNSKVMFTKYFCFSFYLIVKSIFTQVSVCLHFVPHNCAYSLFIILHILLSDRGQWLPTHHRRTCCSNNSCYSHVLSSSAAMFNEKQNTRRAQTSAKRCTLPHTLTSTCTIIDSSRSTTRLHNIGCF